jgi:serine/threonine protein kinase
MPVICQDCGLQSETWTGTCGQCGGAHYVTVGATDPLIGALVANRYRIRRKLGMGTMGSVYLAEDETLGQRFGIKFLNREYSSNEAIVRRFLNEAKTYARLEHPGAVQLHGFGQDPSEGRLYLAMEFVEGKSLRELLDSERLTVAQAVDIAQQLCEVLGHAHLKGVVHRDLKPENVMAARGLRTYRVKVLDFGIAKLLDQSNQTAELIGTPLYMSPEQITSGQVDHRTDIYSLGVLLFELLAGQHPFPKELAIHEVIRRQLEQPLPSLAACGIESQTLDGVIQRATAKDREKRFQSMGDLHDALSSAIFSPMIASAAATAVRARPVDPALARPLTLSPAPVKGRGRIWALAVAAATLVSGMAAALLYRSRTSSQLDLIDLPTASPSKVEPSSPSASPQSTRAQVEAPTPSTASAAPARSEEAPSGASPRPAAAVAERAPFTPPRSKAMAPASRPRLARAEGLELPGAREAHATLNIVTRIDGKPVWASVAVDGKPLDKNTPVSLTLSPGRHRVAVEREGFRPIREDVHLEAGRTEVLKLELTR